MFHCELLQKDLAAEGACTHTKAEAFIHGHEATGQGGRNLGKEDMHARRERRGHVAHMAVAAA